VSAQNRVSYLAKCNGMNSCEVNTFEWIKPKKGGLIQCYFKQSRTQKILVAAFHASPAKIQRFAVALKLQENAGWGPRMMLWKHLSYLSNGKSPNFKY